MARSEHEEEVSVTTEARKMMICFIDHMRQGRQARTEAGDQVKTAGVASTTARRKIRNEAHRGWTRLQMRA